MAMITIKQASKLVGKVPLTVRRSIYKAPEDKKATNEKGHLLIDREYIIDVFSVNSNVPEHSEPISDKAMILLSKQLDNKDDSLNSLNERLKESNIIIASQSQQIKGLTTDLSKANQLLLDPKKDDNDKQESLNNLNDSLSEAHTIINTLTNKLTEVTQKPIETPGTIIDNSKIELLEGVITKLEDDKQESLNNLNNRLDEANAIINKLTDTTQLLLEPITEEKPISKRVFPLLEVISISASILFAGAILFYVLTNKP